MGYVAPLIECISPIKIVKFNVETEQLERDANGHCIVCAPGEPGELISKIDSARAASAFEGYTDKQATEKKIITDVFEKGDRWVRSGDLLRREKVHACVKFTGFVSGRTLTQQLVAIDAMFLV